jgi:hypothetical protein
VASAAAVAVILVVVGLLVVHDGTPARTPTPTTAAGPRESAACNAGARTLETALYAYDADPPSAATGAAATIGVETHVTPGRPASYPTGTQATKLLTNGFLLGWPDHDASFALSLSTSSAGDVDVYIPADSPDGVSWNDETATTGCNALR